MADINYGGSEENYSDALARMKAQEAQIAEQEKATRKLGEAEAASAKAGGQNLGVRKGITSTISAQADAIEAVSAALTRETSLLAANTAAWARAAEARAAALAPARAAPSVIGAPAVGGAYGATTVGYSDALAQFEAQNARAATEGAAARAAAANVAQAAAIRASTQRAPAEPGLYGQLLARQQARREFTEAALTGAREPLQLGSGATFIAGQRGPAIPTTPERAPRVNYDTGLGEFGPARATRDQQALATAQRDTERTLAGVEGRLGRSASAWRLYSAETAAASQALTRHGALSTEFIQALARGEVTLGQFGTALTSTIGKFAGWAVAGGLVYGAFEALKQVVRGATETATGVAQLERAQIPGFNKAQAEQGFRATGARLNVPIAEVSEAQFYAARAGFNKSLPETQSAGETALLAFKLDQVPIQEAARGLGAVRQAFGLNASQIRQVFNELDVGQLKFNARLQQTLPYLGRSSSAFAQAGGSIQQLVRQIIEVTGAVPGGGGGGGSGSAATFFTREPGNLRKPSSEDILRLYGFDPRQPIGDLNEAIQQAVKRKRAPAGQALEAVTPGQTTELTPAQQGSFRLAEALSGGPALAGRYGIQLVNQAANGRAEAITKELAESAGASGEDLKAKLSQFNEQFAAIGHTFERAGSELGASGVVAAGEDFISLIRGIGEATAFVLQPLGQVGSIFSSLPKGLQETAIALGALAVASRAGGFNLLSPDADKKYVAEAKATTSDAIARQKNIIERRASQLTTGGEREYEINREQQRFKEAYGSRLTGPNALPYDDKERTKLQSQSQEIERRRAKQAQENQRAYEQLETAHERLYALEARDARLNDRRTQVSQKAAAARAEGVYVASGRDVIGPDGQPVGARARATGGGAGLAGAIDRTTVGVSAAGTRLEGSVANTANVTDVAATNLRGAWGLAVTQIRAGAAETASAMDAFYAALLSGTEGGRIAALRAAGGAAAGQALSGVKGAGAGLALGLGSTGSTIGQNALKGVMYAFIGSAISEVLGEVVGGISGSKHAGSVVSGIGSDIALGAGAGALLGAPEIGAAVGLGVGILDQSGVFGGGSRADQLKSERLKVEKRKLEEGQSQRDASIAGTQLEVGREIEASIKDETEAATKAKESTTKRLQSFAAQIKVFGPSSEEGKEAGANLSQAVAQLYESQFKTGISGIAKASESFDQALTVLQKTTAEQLSSELPYATTPQQSTAILTSGLGKFREQREKKNEEFAAARKVAEEADTKRNELEDKHLAEVRQEEQRGRAAGLSGAKLQQAVSNVVTTSPIGQQYDAAVKDAESKARVRDKQERALAQADLLFAGAEKAAVIPPAKEAFTLGLRTATSPAQRAGALKQYEGVLDAIYKTAASEVKQPEQEAKQLQEKKRNLEGSLALAEVERSPAAGRIRAAISAVNSQLQAVIDAIKAFHSLLPGLNARFRLLEKESAAFETFDASVKAGELNTKLGIQRAGGDRKKEQEAERKGEHELDQAYRQIPHQYRGTEKGKEAQSKYYEQRTRRATKGLEDVEAENKERLSEVPRSNAGGRRAVETANAERLLQYMQAHKGSGAFDWKKLADAQAAVNEAQSAAGEGLESEQKEIVSLEGEIAQAGAQGNAVAQAGIAISTAQQLIGLAKNQKERLQGQLALIQATNQLQQAQEQHISDIGSLRESTELNPLEKDRTKIDTLNKRLKAAKGPDERTKIQAERNEAVTKLVNDEVSETIDNLKHLQHVGEITGQQVAEGIQKILKTRKLSHAQRRQLENEEYDLLNEGGSFGLGKISPTVYQARTLRNRAPGSHVPTPNIDFTTLHQPPQLHQTNHINVNVAGGHPGQVVAELERVYGVTTRAQLRSARLTG